MRGHDLSDVWFSLDLDMDIAKMMKFLVPIHAMLLFDDYVGLFQSLLSPTAQSGEWRKELNQRRVKADR